MEVTMQADKFSGRSGVSVKSEADKLEKPRKVDDAELAHQLRHSEDIRKSEAGTHSCHRAPGSPKTHGTTEKKGFKPSLRLLRRNRGLSNLHSNKSIDVCGFLFCFCFEFFT